MITWLQQHTLLVLLGAGTIFSAVWLNLLRKRLSLSWYAATLLAVLHTLIGVLSVKSFAFLESGFQRNALGNMSLFGGVFFMPLVYWLGAKLAKRPYRDVFDVFTPCMIFTVMCARINCILSGCCQGLIIPGLNGMRFPTRQAEILLYLILLAILCPKIFRDKLHGTGYLIYMMSYGAFRFIIEFFRDAETNALFHLAHLWALLTLIVGISLYAEISAKKPSKKRRG